MTITRRTFLSHSAAVSAVPFLPTARPLGSSEDLRVAVVGVRGQGQTHIREFEKLDGVRVVALCDVDPSVLAERADKHAASTGRAIARVVDVRALLDSFDIDVISIATPNHWHSLMAIWACQAGKDVYVEKPISHNVWEGGQVVAAARKYDRIVQGGTQSRSFEAVRDAVAFVQGGGIGALQRVRGLCYKPRQSIGKAGKGELPSGLDYDLWCGPAPKRPLARANLHYDWHWVYDTGNGDMGNQGIHQMDVARWMLGVDGFPAMVMSVGGRLGYDDDGTTPNSQVVVLGYEPAPLVFETRGLPSAREFQASDDAWRKNMDAPEGFGGRGAISVVAECADGQVMIDSGGRGAAIDGDGAVVREFSGGGNHYANFIGAVRSRRREDQNAEVRETHLSSALCHLGMISHLLGSPISGAIGRVGEGLPAADRVRDLCAHLERNSVDPAGLIMGKALALDPATGRFVNDHAADQLATRHYRTPFAVPDEV